MEKPFFSWHSPYLYQKDSLVSTWSIVLALTFASMTAIIDLLAFVVVQTEIEGALAIDPVQTTWLGKAFFFAAAIAPLYATPLAARCGYKKIYLLGLILFWTGSFLTPFGWNFLSMFFLRFLSGTGGGIVMAISLGYLTKIVHEGARDRALAFYSNVFFGLGITVGVLLGGYLGQSYHWQTAFYMNIHLALPNLLLVLLLLPETAKEHKGPFDIYSFLFLTASLVCLLYVVIEAKNPATTQGWLSPVIQSAQACALLFFLAFILSNFLHKNPLVPLSLFSYPQFCVACLGLIIMGFQIFGISLIAMGLLETAYLYERIEIGYFISTLGLIYCFVGILPIYFAKKIPPRYFILIGLLLVIYSNMTTQEITIQSTWYQMNFYQSLRSFGLALLLGPFAVMAFLPLQQQEIEKASSFIASLRFVAATFGSALVDLFIQERAPFHEERFKEQINPFSPTFLGYLEGYKERFLHLSLTPTETKEALVQLLQKTITDQALIAALNDAVLLLGLFSCVVFVSVLLLTLFVPKQDRKFL